VCRTKPALRTKPGAIYGVRKLSARRNHVDLLVGSLMKESALVEDRFLAASWGLS
jgi:hypothetical protein